MCKAFDAIILGAGLYGLYAAKYLCTRGRHVLVLEADAEPFSRATYINQARVHMGYHYPRSLSTALKSAGYYRRFHEDFSFAIHDRFRQIYATSARFSWTDAAQFRSFCEAAGIVCEPVPVGRYFNEQMADGAFLTEEDTYDAHLLRDHYMDALRAMPGCEMVFGVQKEAFTKAADRYRVAFALHGAEETAEAPFVLNATYASVNQVLSMVSGEETDDFAPFRMKYELCEIILCDVSDALREIGLTVMDGPFFSIMPFGKSGLHSLTAVTFTPHMTCHEALPVFPCQNGTDCTGQQLCNCNTCPHKPQSAWPYMSHLARKFVRHEYGFTYRESLYSMKPILLRSEVDDSRPTCIRVNSEAPMFVSVLSGKINTVYDLDAFLEKAC